MVKSERQFDEACQNEINREEVPIGFALSLAKNEKAMERFSSMSGDEKNRAIECSRKMKSKRDMECFVDRLGQGNSFY